MDKKHYIPIVYVFFDKDYLIFFMYVVKIRDKVAKIDLIPSLD